MRPLFFPLFNSLIDWTENKSAPPPTAKRN
jgi:hypothetical protein